MNEYAAGLLEEENTVAWEAEGEYAVLNTIINNATFAEIPEEYLEEARTSIEATLNMYASLSILIKSTRLTPSTLSRAF